MRHWFATNLMRNGATIKQIQYALGHSSPKTTMVYLGIDEEDEAAIAELSVMRRKPGSTEPGKLPPTPHSTTPPAATNSAESSRGEKRAEWMKQRRRRVAA